MAMHENLRPPNLRILEALTGGAPFKARGGSKVYFPISGPPNYDFMAMLNRLGRAHFDPISASDWAESRRACLEWFRHQEIHGHGCSQGPGELAYELGFGSPHDIFDLDAVIGILLIAIARKDDELCVAAISWLGREAWLGRKFRAGSRTLMPTTRANVKPDDREPQDGTSTYRDVLTYLVHGGPKPKQVNPKWLRNNVGFGALSKMGRELVAMGLAGPPTMPLAIDKYEVPGGYVARFLATSKPDGFGMVDPIHAVENVEGREVRVWRDFVGGPDIPDTAPERIGGRQEA